MQWGRGGEGRKECGLWQVEAAEEVAELSVLYCDLGIVFGEVVGAAGNWCAIGEKALGVDAVWRRTEDFDESRHLEVLAEGYDFGQDAFAGECARDEGHDAVRAGDA